MIEIERKFLVRSDEWMATTNAGTLYSQSYLASGDTTVRVRIAGEQAFLTVKGPPKGISRAEYEYEIPVAEAHEMLTLCSNPPVEKTRYLLVDGELTWEIDVFHGANDGLIVAEIELPSEDTVFHKPSWLGAEVSHERRYTNAALAQHPFTTWSNER